MGVIDVAGKPLSDMAKGDQSAPADERHPRPRRSDIDMDFQQFTLFPHMTVRQNCIEAPIHVLGISRAEAKERACFVYGGRIAKQGTPEETFSNPTSERTLQFLSVVLDAG